MHFGQLNTSAEGNGDSVYLRQPLSVLRTLLAASDGEMFCLQRFHHAALAVSPGGTIDGVRSSSLEIRGVVFEGT